MEFIQFYTLGGGQMTIKQLQEKETKLSDRISRLKSSIIETKKNLTIQSIPGKAEEIKSLQVQLELTETVLKDTQEKLREQKKFLASKEYKDKLKIQEKLKEQATRKTAAILEKLVPVQAEAKEVFKLCKQHDKLNRETSKLENSMQFFINLDCRQPFSWLKVISGQVNFAVKRAEYIKDKLEV